MSHSLHLSRCCLGFLSLLLIATGCADLDEVGVTTNVDDPAIDGGSSTAAEPLVEGQPVLCSVDANTNYCGGANPNGCSCKSECEFLGTCCADYQTACGAFPGRANSADAVRGRALWKSSGAAVAARVHFFGAANDWHQVNVGALRLNGNSVRDVAGLTSVTMSEVDTPNEAARCTIREDKAGMSDLFWHWALDAFASHATLVDDVAVGCGARVLHLGDVGGVPAEAFESGRATTSSSGLSMRSVRINGGWTGPTIGTGRTQPAAYNPASGILDGYAVLTSVRLSNTNSSTAACYVQYNGNTFDVVASTTGVASATCEGRFIDGAQSGLQFAGLFTRESGEADLRLLDAGTNTCFLTWVEVTDVSDVPEADLGAAGIDGEPISAGCSLSEVDDHWQLSAIDARGDGAPLGNTVCQAACFSHGGRSWPPAPEKVLNTPTGLGATAYLYSYGAGLARYDSPAVFIEGGDATNMIDSHFYARITAEAMAPMLEQGFDLWVIDFTDSGQESMLANAEATADLIETIAGLGGSSHVRMPALGGSEGANRLKIALRAWEDGNYGHIVSGNQPPVSLMLGVNPTVLGTNVPMSLQAFAADAGTGVAQFASNPMIQSLRSVNTSEALTQYVRDFGVFTTCWPSSGSFPPSWVGGILAPSEEHTHDTCWISGTTASPPPQFRFFRDGNTHIDAGTCDHFRDEWGNPLPWGRRGLHDRYLAPAGAFVSGGNMGFPQSVSLKVGISNGSWFPQDFSRYPDDILDRLIPPANQNPGSCPVGGLPDELAQFDFLLRMEPHDSRIGTGDCFRSSTFRMHIEPGFDDAPGDLSPLDLAQINDEMAVGLRGFVHRLEFTQARPMMYNRTDSSLACPAGGWPTAADPFLTPITGSNALSTDAACRATNRPAGQPTRWDYVHSQQMRNGCGQVYNGAHNGLELENRLLLNLYVWDCRVQGFDASGTAHGPGDCDGFWSNGKNGAPANPYLAIAATYVAEAAAAGSPASIDFISALQRIDCNDHDPTQTSFCGWPRPWP